MDADQSCGPLTTAEVRQLDSTLLPALERHHLRLLAHGLRSLQAAAGRRHGALADEASLQRWVAAQPQLASAGDFIQVFLDQLRHLGAQLEEIAAEQRCGPLDLSLEQLVDWARSQADQRTSSHTPASPSPAASQPRGPG